MGKAITPIAPKFSGNKTAPPGGGKNAASGPASSILKFARRVIELEAGAVAQLAGRLNGQFE
ncbi:MAG: hypothetical protein L0Z48_03800, partial [candidate division Zixibacteria bacterium]|nr:hypothetical protein [candidate division Zixibacteria bacterium]